MIRLSVPLRQALARLSVPVLIAAGFGTMLLGKADTLLVERTRMALADLLAPLYAVAAEPIGAVRHAVTEAQTLFYLQEEAARLRLENDRLHRWQAAALALEAENALLRRQLSFVPDPAPQFRTARVVADAGGTYARAVLISTGPFLQVQKGQVALDERGLAGRVTEVGARSARILLVTDMNSRIPVVLEGSRARAMMVGTNGARPRLQHWPSGMQPREGDRVVTSAESATFPAGLPVGVVRLGETGWPEVELFAQLDRLDLLRIFEFGLAGILPPEAVTRPDPSVRPRR
ncbi:rod shape-determining protein MreC [Roseomonas sp. SSH11]|uniref:Cell shape-determining protein MreC n=1 Tax=Pararoseomonas baculiformis TaxID=2820812 RepID=A0ABS4ADS2_9PROT|nr:rod shape-determining protein MreC [Pararoseomonas baculiformis]MBP0445157.1 rod shape-determining protein MreC [Pararoseomonas baculiformis]